MPILDTLFCVVVTFVYQKSCRINFLLFMLQAISRKYREAHWAGTDSDEAEERHGGKLRVEG